MKHWIILCCLLSLLLLWGCASEGDRDPARAPDNQPEQPSADQTEDQPEDLPAQPDDQPEAQPEDQPEEEATASYVNITPQEAKALMDGEEKYIILDVREVDEYAEGHIPGALLFPLGEINAERAAALLPDKNVMLLVYCRSGRRSKLAASELVKLGYTNVKEFGGIIDWPYETV